MDCLLVGSDHPSTKPQEKRIKNDTTKLYDDERLDPYQYREDGKAHEDRDE